jgi:hypothetical protein
MHEYCTYLTVYKGSSLPPFYIGSTSVKRIKDGYRGSVRSFKYLETWNNELNNNPELFETKIISLHNTRKDALEKENYFHKKLEVVKNNLYINQAMASGCFGNMGDEAVAKMKATKSSKEWKETTGKATGKKISAIRNNKEWKETVGKAAAEKLSATKRDPARAEIEAERNRKNSETVNDPVWKETIGKERAKKISESVKKLQSTEEWRSTKGVQRIENMKNTINSPKWKATIGLEANKKRGASVSRTRKSPEWKEKNSVVCELCDLKYPKNVMSRHLNKCKRNIVATITKV